MTRMACPVDHCPRTLPRSAVMCSACWRSLPEPIQRRVVRAYWDWKEAGRYGTAESVEVEAALHLQHAIVAKQDAISAAGFARRDQRVPVQLFGWARQAEGVAA